MLVRKVVGELEFMKGDDLLHPLLPGGGAVRMDVHPLRHLGVRLPGHYPSAVVELVSKIVGGHNVQEKNVFCFRIQTGETKLHLGKHLPKK